MVVDNSRVAVAARMPAGNQRLSSVRSNAGIRLTMNTAQQKMTMPQEKRRGCSTVVAARRDGDDRYEQNDGFQDRVIQVRRVTKVVKGGKQLRFRAVVRVSCFLQHFI